MGETRLYQIEQYFWGDDLAELEWKKHKNSIIQTLLNKGDTPAIQWLFTQVTASELQDLLPTLQLEPKSANFWQIYLS